MGSRVDRREERNRGAKRECFASWVVLRRSAGNRRCFVCVSSCMEEEREGEWESGSCLTNGFASAI